MDYLISDTHWGHSNIIKYTDRPFNDVDTMNKVLIKNWNSVIKKNDRVFHLGDVCFFGKSRITELLLQLRGKKILIKGNHDNNSNKWYLDAGFSEVYDKPILMYDKFILSHKPIEIENMGSFINIHGHIHEKSMSDLNYVNVSVEHIDYTPIAFNKIIEKY